MKNMEQQFDSVPKMKIEFINDPEQYERLHTEQGGGNLKGEALRLLKPAFNSQDGLYIYKPTFEQVKGYDEDYMKWIVEHEQMEYDLDMKAMAGSADNLAELKKLGLPDKREDEKAFFIAIHKKALENEVNAAISSGKSEAYEGYITNYLTMIQNKINRGEVDVSDEDFSRFKERQNERIDLLKKYRETSV